MQPHPPGRMAAHPSTRGPTHPIMNARTKAKIGYNTFVILLLLAVIIYAFSHFFHFGHNEYTDDAQVQRHITPVNTRVQGFIKEIRFEEYQQVHQGDTLVILENSEYLLQVAQAEANYQAVAANAPVISAAMTTTTSNVQAAEAGIEEARVNMENARTDYERYEALLARDAVTRQQYDNMKARYESARARYEQASASRNATSLVRTEQAQRLSQNDASIDVAEAALNLARLNLSYTVILATADGTMGRKEIHEGQLVQPGQQLARIVHANDVWVIANYRESQMKHIAVGSDVNFTADALPGHKYKGTVERISPATGAAYSMVPADNATGNFVKVEQRIPVRIRITEENTPEELALLLSGMNVETKVVIAR